MATATLIRDHPRQFVEETLASLNGNGAHYAPPMPEPPPPPPPDDEPAPPSAAEVLARLAPTTPPRSPAEVEKEALKLAEACSHLKRTELLSVQALLKAQGVTAAALKDWRGAVREEEKRRKEKIKERQVAAKEAAKVRRDEKPKSAEYIAALAALGYFFRLNECNDGVEVNGEPLSDVVRAKIRAEMRDAGFEYVNVMEDAYTAEAYANRYHPIREYLEGLEHDGKDHIARLAGYFKDTHSPIAYAGGESRAVFHAWLRRWLIGAVGKALDAEQNMMLVIDGPQNLGKSYFARWLARPLPDYFVEAPIDPDDKDAKMRLISTWLWEVSELGATTRRRDREALKDFITRRVESVRPPYGRTDIKKRALASLIGTINNEAGFLNDPTGSRRFMVATLAAEGIDRKYATEMEPSQVWAQAYALYQAGERGELTAEEKATQSALNGGYEIDDPMQDWIEEHLELTGNEDDFMSSAAIVDKLQAMGMRGSTTALQMQLGKTAARMGLEKARQPVRGGKMGYKGIRPRPIHGPSHPATRSAQPPMPEAPPPMSDIEASW